MVLVVGASGYLGRHLCKLLSKKHEVCGTYFRNPVKITEQNVFLDIRDKQAVDALFQEINPDLVYHLAYDREDLDASIVDGTRNLLKASAQWCPTSPFIFISTDAVFDGEKGPYREDDVPRPIWKYGEAKRRAEEEVLKSGGMVVRISLVYGFNPPDPRTESLEKGIETGNFEHSYFKDEIRCPTFVEDLCAALMEIGEGKAGDSISFMWRGLRQLTVMSLQKNWPELLVMMKREFLKDLCRKVGSSALEMCL